MHVVMKLIPTKAKMRILIMYQFLLHTCRCLGFSFIGIQDYGCQNLAFLVKIFLLGQFILEWSYLRKQHKAYKEKQANYYGVSHRVR